MQHCSASARARPAREHLLAGYTGLKAQAAKLTPVVKLRRTEALERLIDFGKATNDPQRAEWEADRAASLK